VAALEPLEDLPQVVKLLIKSLAYNDHIVQVHHSGFTRPSRTDAFSCLNLAGALQQTLSTTERCLLNVTVVVGSLPIAILQIKG
jgi:hypothetical protein